MKPTYDCCGHCPTHGGDTCPTAPHQHPCFQPHCPGGDQ